MDKIRLGAYKVTDMGKELSVAWKELLKWTTLIVSAAMSFIIMITISITWILGTFKSMTGDEAFVLTTTIVTPEINLFRVVLAVLYFYGMYLNVIEVKTAADSWEKGEQAVKNIWRILKTFKN